MSSKARSFIFIIFGLLALTWGIKYFISTERQIQFSTKTTGTVVNLIPHRGSKGSTTYERVVQFATQSGETVTAEEGISTSPTSNVGDQVPVYYENNHPQKIIIDTFMSRYGMPLIFAGLGVIFIFIGGTVFFKGKKQQKEMQQLKQNGIMIGATVRKGAMKDGFGGAQSAHAFFYAEGTDPFTNKLRTFTSTDLVLYGTRQKIKENDVVRVYIHPTNPNKYVIDCSAS